MGKGEKINIGKMKEWKRGREGRERRGRSMYEYVLRYMDWKREPLWT